MADQVNAPTLGFIGFGNMAQAMAKGLVEAGALPGTRIYATAAHFDKLQASTAALGAHACEDARGVVKASDFVVVAVKPHLVASVLEPVRDALAAPGKAVISVAAGCGFDFYEGVLAPGTHHLSTIPNTPIAVGAGVVACEQRHSLSEGELAAFEDLFGQVALIEWVDGKLLSQMMMGTAKLHLETGTHPGAMKDAVCSPGGTTIKGVASLEKDAFRGAVINAIDAIEG